MRIMLDTNVLISAIVLNSSKLNEMIEYIVTKHKLVLSSYVIDELKTVTARKFQVKSSFLDEFLVSFPYELVYTPEVMDDSLFEIRDPADYPVLYTAIIDNIDILITGDQDLTTVEIEKPEILTPSAFIKNYL